MRTCVKLFLAHSYVFTELIPDSPNNTNMLHKILAISPISAYKGSNTSVSRLKGFQQDPRVQVSVIDSASKFSTRASELFFRGCGFLYRKGFEVPIPFTQDINTKILSDSVKCNYDILYLEKALMVDPTTLETIRRINPKIHIMGFSPDDMNARHSQSVQFMKHLRYYDSFFTTKSYNVAELKHLGCRNVFFIDNGFDPEKFFRTSLSASEVDDYGCDVSFIGAYEYDRYRSIRYLANNGIKVRIWGHGWKKVINTHAAIDVRNEYLGHDTFAKAVSATKVNLAFLRKANRDLQTTRTMEIPACGGFMLAERTIEHLRLFQEGKEASFFASDDELLKKVKYYLENAEERIAIANAGYNRCIASEYSDYYRVKQMLDIVFAIRQKENV